MNVHSYHLLKNIAVSAAAMATVLLVAAGNAEADETGLWTSFGQDRQNTRHQGDETKISVATVGSLAKKWEFTTGGDVSATPAVDATAVYFPDWAGNLYKVNRATGTQIWKASIPAITGLPGDKARATPAVTDRLVIVGTQGPFGLGGKMLAFDKLTGALVWSTQVEAHPAAVITQSATVFAGNVYIGVSSLEEALAAFIPGYPCCSFKGSMTALDEKTGYLKWKTYIVPDGYSGGAVWGSGAAVDPRLKQIYIATGNNYSVPQSVLDCVALAGDDSVAQSQCLPANNHFDSIMALDMATGAVRWSKRAIPYDAWNVDCIPFFGDGSNCPSPAGPDYDFGQGPSLFNAISRGGGVRRTVGAGQKSGQYWALDPATGTERWVTNTGPGGTAGGLQWGSAVDGRRIYTANANSNAKPWTLPSGQITDQGMWSALNATTGAIIWQTVPPHGGGASGPASSANGVMFGCSLDPQGYMYALNGATGAVLWEFASGGSCLSGAAISDGEVFWGSGYSNFGFGTPNNKLYAFSLQ